MNDYAQFIATIKQFLSLALWPILAPLRFIQSHFKASVFVLVVFLIFRSGGGETLSQANLYRIDLTGPILDSTAFLEAMHQAKAENIKGLLLVVNSPGGAVPPSVEMMMAVRDYAKERPVVVYASGLLASGSYYASIYGTEIIANPASIVGSIGVIFQGFNAKELLDKIGIKPHVIKSGKYKEVGAAYRDWEEYETRALTELSTDIYRMFVSDVVLARKLKIEDEKHFADGQVFLASKAKNLGLVDRIGNLEMAEERLAELAGVGVPSWNQKSKMETLLERVGEKASVMLVNQAYRLSSGM